jgi:hypothetical protein
MWRAERAADPPFTLVSQNNSRPPRKPGRGAVMVFCTRTLQPCAYTITAGAVVIPRNSAVWAGHRCLTRADAPVAFRADPSADRRDLLLHCGKADDSITLSH